MMTRRVFWVAAAATSVTGWTTPAAAHPQHDSVAHVHLRSDRLEVSLRVAPEDLEEALRVANKRRIDLDRTPNVDRLVVAYLRQQFTVRRPGQSPRAVHWVGKQVDVARTWLYFELALPAGPAGHVFTNTLFFEIAPTQVNTVLLHTEGKTRTLVFTRERPQHPLT